MTYIICIWLSLICLHYANACPAERWQAVAVPLLQALLPWATSRAHPLRCCAMIWPL